MNSRIEWKRIETPYGPMVLAARAQALIGAWFEGQKHFNGVQVDWQEELESAVLREAERQLHEWFAGKRRDFALALAPEGSEFQRMVWAAIARLGFGETADYGTLARQLGRPKAARAVGAATGRNPLTIIIPCHRLLGRDGKLTGYAGGLERKQALLAFEAQASA
jgi:methylated-DNA-[protein]-cysteine S-methyltransferase